jgi:3-deoxy-7-phosphoheptulonate synthase
LRGGRQRTNYDAASIAEAREALVKASLPDVIMVDCSHANSGNQHARQEEVWRSVLEQRKAGNAALIGLMVESNLHEGSQPMQKNPADLQYGVSITDACVNWETTERMVRDGWKALRR